MLNIPSSTLVNRFIPKDKFYGKTPITHKLRQLFTEEIEKINWAHKISPETLNITATDYVELQIFEINLKKTELSTSILKHIDTFIPYPILFILKSSSLVKAIISFKEPTTRSENFMRVDTYFETNWQSEIDLKLKGRSVDEIYKNYLYQVAPNLKSIDSIDPKNAIETNKISEKLLKQIELINRKIVNEPSIAKRQKLAHDRYDLERQIESLSC